MEGSESLSLDGKLPSEVEAECLLEGVAVRARFDAKVGVFSWQPSQIHRSGSGFGLTRVDKSGSINLQDDLLGFHYGASTIMFRLFPKSRACSFLCVPCGGQGRKQRDLLLDFRDHNDHGAFAEVLEAWLNSSGRPRRLLVIVNPKGGKGKARELYLREVLPLLEAAGITVTMLETNYHRHAAEIARGLNINLYDGVACVSGDGIPTEVVNGFLERPDWQRAIQIPIGHILAGASHPLSVGCSAEAEYLKCQLQGSGNGMAKSAMDAGGESQCNVDNATFAVIAGKRCPLDVITATQGSKKFHAVLNIGWGIVSDVDIESERYRWMGGLRLTVQTIVRTMNLRRYDGTLSYLPASREFLDQAMMGGASSAAAAAAAAAAGPEGQFKGPSIEDLESAGEWQTLEGEFVLLWAQNMPWAATDMHAAPMAQLWDGAMDVMVLQKCSSFKMLSLFLEMQSGKHISSPLLKYLKVRAMKLTPGKRTRGRVGGGILAMDGEVVARGPGAVGNSSEDPMEYGQPVNFTVSQGLLQLFVA